MATEKTARVTWAGDLTGGKGTIESVGSGLFGPLPVTWAARTGEESGLTSPEELIAAAHAACFSMALGNVLGKAGSPPDHLEVTAAVTFVPGPGITTSALEVIGTVSGLDQDAFRQAAEDAKENCPVSKALSGNVDISVRATLAS
jgi:osmotically inducible protein OsmC